jgi:epoxyqueuosine reductase
MKNDELKQWIIREAKIIGIDKIGFTDASNFEHLRTSIQDQQINKRNSGFEHPNLDERLNPEFIFDEPKSIISIALAYPTKILETKATTDKRKRGKFARASWGVDYHHILKEKMNVLIKAIKQKVEQDYEFKPMVDTGELIDVAVAQRAGLGFIGKNGLLITEEFGSWVYLGEIITNIEFEPDEPIENECGDCTRCIDSCPTQALMGNETVTINL